MPMEGLKAMAAKPPVMPMVAEVEDEGRDGILTAADDLLAAIKTGDRELVADALEAAHEACSGKEY